jgi:hypothetical protein
MEIITDESSADAITARYGGKVYLFRRHFRQTTCSRRLLLNLLGIKSYNILMLRPGLCEDRLSYCMIGS